MKKRVLATLLCMAMGVSLVACGGKETTTDAPAADTKTEEKAEEKAEEPAKEEAPAADAEAEGEGFHLDVCIANGGDPNFDPMMSNGTLQSMEFMHFMEGLMKYGAGESSQAGTNPDARLAVLQCAQAESYEYDEATFTYTFHLRDDIFWTDGKPVTADDYVFAFQRMIDPETAASTAALFTNQIKNWTKVYNGEGDPTEIGVTAVDEKTLVIELEAEVPYFLSQLTHYNTVPQRKDIFEANPDFGLDYDNVVTNGAYKISEVNPGVSYTMVKNEDYYDYENLGPDSITWHITNNETTILASYQAGEWDYVSGTPAAQRETLEASGDLFSGPSLGYIQMYLNVENTPDWRVRAAYALAIDRENIVNNAVKNGAQPANGMIPLGMKTYDGATEWTEYAGETMWWWLQENYPDYDLSDYIGRCELAQALYAEAVADGFDTTVSPTIMFGNSEVNKLIAESIQADLLNVLEVNLVINGTDALNWEDDFTFGRLGFGADYDDQCTFLNNYGTNGMFEFSHWSNPEYDELVKKAMSMPYSAERDEIMLEAERLLYSDTGFGNTPLYNMVSTYCIRDGLTNLFYIPLHGSNLLSYVKEN